MRLHLPISPPLVRRELVALLRTRRAFWLTLGVVTMSFSFPLLGWSDSSYDALSSPYFALDVFIAFVIIQTVSTLLALPAFTAGSFAGERESGTWELLRTAPLSSTSIALSKIVAASSFLLILLMTTLPGGFVLYLIGGLAVGTVALLYGLVLATVVTTTTVCLTVSFRSRSTAHAAVRSIVWIIFWNGGLCLLGYLFLGLAHALDVVDGGELLFPGIDLGAVTIPEVSVDDLWWFNGFLCPPAAMSMQAYAESGPAGFPVWLQPWTGTLAYLLVVTGAHAAYLILRMPVDAAASEAPAARRATRRARARIRRPLLIRALLSLADHGALSTLVSPVFAKEARADFFGRRRFRFLGFWPPLVVGLLVCVLAEGVWLAMLPITAVAMTLVAFVGAGAAATCITREDEQGNLDLLRGTLQTPGEIVLGKITAALLSCWGLVCALGWVAVAFAIFGDPEPFLFGERPRSIPLLARFGLVALPVVSTLLLLVFVVTLGAWASLVSRRSLGALAKAYGLILGFFLIAPIIVGMIGDAADFSSESVMFFGALNPWVASLGPLGFVSQAKEPEGEVVAMFFGFLVVYGVLTTILMGYCIAIWRRRRAIDP